MNTLIVILSQIAAFQSHDHFINRTPQHLIEPLTRVACTLGSDTFAEALNRFERQHHVKLDDEVWEAQDQCEGDD